MPDSPYTKTFAGEMQEYELDQVAERRSRVHSPQTESGRPKVGAADWGLPRDDAGKYDPLQADLVGLAFSGGGIRSATFNLGVLQALGRLKLLTRVDYLSTVSGGGYIGGWLAAWIRRVSEGGPDRAGRPTWTAVEAVESHLDPRAERMKVNDPSATEPEPETIHHLREHSRYLSPRFGLFSLDTWALLAIYARNLLVTWLVVVPMLLTVAVFCRWLVALFAAWPADRHAAARSGGVQALTTGAFVVFLAGLVVAEAVVRVWLFKSVFMEGGTARSRAAGPGGANGSAPTLRGRAVRSQYLWLAGAAGLLAVATLGVWVEGPAPWSRGGPFEGASRMPEALRVARPLDGFAAVLGGPPLALAYDAQPLAPDAAGGPNPMWYAPGLTAFLSVPSSYFGDYLRGILLFAALGALGGFVGAAFAEGQSAGRRAGYFALTVVFGAVFGALFTALVNEVLFFDGRNHPALFVAIGPPLFLAAAVAAGFVETMVAGRAYHEYEREWRSRLAGWLLSCAAAWLLVFGAVVFLPWGLQQLDQWAFGPEGRKVIPWGTFAGWVATTLFGLFAARRTAAGAAGPSLRMVARVVPVLFLAGLLAIAGEVSLQLPWLGAPDPPPAGGTADPWPKVGVTADGPPGRVEVAVDWRAGDGRPRPRTHLDRLEDPTADPQRLLTGFGVLLLAFAAAVNWVPATQFSLHSLYMNRLTRAYLGASLKDPRDGHGAAGLDPRHKRAANNFTGFDPHDDLPLAALRVKEADLPAAWKEKGAYLGPYPLFNTTLNLVAGEELAYQDRKGGAFVLTPAYCGSEPTGYALLRPDADNGQDVFWNLTVGRAMTVSGAAVDPNMQNYQSPQLTAFLTLLNARLGWWIENPLPGNLRAEVERAAGTVETARAAGDLGAVRAAAARLERALAAAEAAHPIAPLIGRARTQVSRAADELRPDEPDAARRAAADAAVGAAARAAREAVAATSSALPGAWSAKPPQRPLAGWPYLREFAGQTDTKWDYVHLSDGGHFENTGAYELVRRRCRHVVVIDAAEDPADASENLANLIRLVRTDFGIPIDIDTSPVHKDADGLSRWHCAVGAIRYDEVDKSGVTGTLVFIRPSLTGDEEADLKNYAATNPPFPHHSTADQFFDEAQFESYRQLGFHIGMEVFGRARQEVGEPYEVKSDERYRGYTRQLFGALRRAWAPLPEGFSANYLTSCRDYLKTAADLRDGQPPPDQPDRGLRRVSRSLFAEARHLPFPIRRVPPASAEPPGVDTDPYYTDLHEVDYLLQVMELAWLENDLDRYGAHPQNRGWMNVFRRWTASGAFHRYWPVLRGQYSREFVRFCSVALNLADPPVKWCRLKRPEDQPWKRTLDDFGIEFQREWAEALLSIEDLDPVAQRCYLSAAVAASAAGRSEPLAWVVTNGLGGEREGPVSDVAWLAAPDEAVGPDPKSKPEYRPPHAAGQAPRAYTPMGLVVAFDPAELRGELARRWAAAERAAITTRRAALSQARDEQKRAEDRLKDLMKAKDELAGEEAQPVVASPDEPAVDRSAEFAQKRAVLDEKVKAARKAVRARKVAVNRARAALDGQAAVLNEKVEWALAEVRRARKGVDEATSALRGETTPGVARAELEVAETRRDLAEAELKRAVLGVAEAEKADEGASPPADDPAGRAATALADRIRAAGDAEKEWRAAELSAARTGKAAAEDALRLAEGASAGPADVEERRVRLATAKAAYESKSRAAAEGAEYELLVWVRSAYRSMGLGRGCLPYLLSNESADPDPEEKEEKDRKGIVHELKGKAGRLVVRYPQLTGTAGDRLQRRVWTWFFNDHDFVGQGDDPRDADPAEIRLVRHLKKSAADWSPGAPGPRRRGGRRAPATSPVDHVSAGGQGGQTGAD